MTKKTLTPRAAIIASALFVLTAGGATAQDHNQYETVLRPPTDVLNWRIFYETRNEWTRETKAALPHKLDIAYGTDPKQKLDIYFPKGEVKNAPVMIFFHGGGFVEGDKSHYGYVAREYAKQGVITVVPSYRLGGWKVPDQYLDAEHAVAWVYKNIAAMGGDPNKLVISGHSAGAFLVGAIGTDRTWMPPLGLPMDALKGSIPVSASLYIAPLDAPRGTLGPNGRPPVRINNPAYIVAVAGTAEPQYEPTKAFGAALKAQGVASELIIAPGHGHQETADVIGDEYSPVFQAAMKLLK